MGSFPNIRALRSVREQRGLGIVDVASFTNISSDRLQQFESGERGPSRKQLEKLAATYGIPIYSLFSEGIPNLPELPLDFRKATPSPASLTARGVKALLLAERISVFTRQLGDELNFVPANLVHSARRGNSPEKRATQLRAMFDDWLRPRSSIFSFSGTQEHRFMSALRLFFEIQGSIVNVNDAPAEDYLGFFVVPPAGIPTIFVNRSISSKKAQLFTLAHEYCHALLGVSGISNPFSAKNSIERTCNVFAAEFLAPMVQFSKIVEKIPQSSRIDVGRFIEAASAKTLLSKHAAAIRLVEGDYITQRQLMSWRRVFTANVRAEKDEEKENADPPAGGAPHAKRLSEIGYLPILLAKQAVEKRIIDSLDVADGIGLSVTLQERAFSLVARRYDAALA